MPSETFDYGIAEEMYWAQAFQDGVVTLIKYKENGSVRREAGVAYGIKEDKLIIGPYFAELSGDYPRNFVLDRSHDLTRRTKLIPLEDIAEFAVVDIDGIPGKVQHVLRNPG